MADQRPLGARLFNRACINITPHITDEELGRRLARAVGKATVDRHRVGRWRREGGAPVEALLGACELAHLSLAQVEQMELEAERRGEAPAYEPPERRQVRLQVVPGLLLLPALVLFVVVLLVTRSPDPHVWISTAGSAIQHVTQPLQPEPDSAAASPAPMPAHLASSSKAQPDADDVPARPTPSPSPSPTRSPVGNPGPAPTVQPLVRTGTLLRVAEARRAALRHALDAAHAPPPAPAPTPTPSATPAPAPEPSPDPGPSPPVSVLAGG